MLGVDAMARHRNDYIFAPEKEKGGGLGCFITFLALVLALGVAAVLFNSAANKRVLLEEEKVAVMSLDKAFEGFTVLHMSDLHASELAMNADNWRSLLFSKSFHAVVMSGDMVGSDGDFEPLVTLVGILRDINQTAPIFFIAGDDDPSPIITTPLGTKEVFSDWVRAAQKAGAVYLDAPVGVEAGKRKVWFVPEVLYDVDAAGMVGALTNQKADMEAQGMQYESEGGATYRTLCYRLDAMERTVAAQKEMLSTDMQIAVTHAPLIRDYIRNSLEWADQDEVFNYRAITLMLAGHYCGGQWRIPRVGAVYVPDVGWFPPDEGIRGMQRVNSMNQYISPGLGASEYYPMKGRLFNAPTVTLLKFSANLK